MLKKLLIAGAYRVVYWTSGKDDGYGKLEFLQTHELQKFPVLQLKLNKRTPAIHARLISIAPGYGAVVITCSHCLNNTSDILIGIIVNH